MVYESLFYVNFVHGFMFSVSTNENFKYAKKIFIGLHAERRKKSGCTPKIFGPKYMEAPWMFIPALLLGVSIKNIREGEHKPVLSR